MSIFEEIVEKIVYTEDVKLTTPCLQQTTGCANDAVKLQQFYWW